jgi:predicted sulfurtransferase
MLCTAVAPETLKSQSPTEGQTGSRAHARSSDVVILDVRNGYEWDAGHFVGAERPLEVR